MVPVIYDIRAQNISGRSVRFESCYRMNLPCCSSPDSLAVGFRVLGVRFMNNVIKHPTRKRDLMALDLSFNYGQVS